MEIDGSTQLVGLFGSPVAHTASPAMHNAAFAALKMNWCYLACPVEPRNLRTALLGARDMGFRGVNLTVPHKILALDVVDEIDTEARKLGAVNTILFDGTKLRGFNSDGYGFERALKEEFDLSLKGKRILVLGAGGAGRAIAIKCGLAGAAKVIVANRTVAKIQPIAAQMATLKAPFEQIALAVRDVQRVIATVDVLVNATPVGLKTSDSLGLPASLFTSKLVVYDTIYRPAETELIRLASEGGAKVSNGLSMLLHQGARSFEIWTKCKAPLAVMRRALRASVYGEKT
jgi:shikimate dehydrogenase